MPEPSAKDIAVGFAMFFAAVAIGTAAFFGLMELFRIAQRLL